MFAQSNVRKDYGLTERERRVVELMVQGLAKKNIADELDLKLHGRLHDALHLPEAARQLRRRGRVGAVRDHLVPPASARAALRKIKRQTPSQLSH